MSQQINSVQLPTDFTSDQLLSPWNLIQKVNGIIQTLPFVKWLSSHKWGSWKPTEMLNNFFTHKLKCHWEGLYTLHQMIQTISLHRIHSISFREELLYISWTLWVPSQLWFQHLVDKTIDINFSQDVITLIQDFTYQELTCILNSMYPSQLTHQ